MDDTRFDAMIASLEQEARRAPASYKSKVLWLCGLGSAYVVAVLLLLLGVVAALVYWIAALKWVAAKLLIFVVPLLWTLVSVLRVRLAAPVGLEVTAAMAPELHAMLDDLGRRIGAPPFHHVLVTGDFNAGVAQVPRLGPLGWHRNYLLLGLPLMRALTVDQFRAVLAHELGHLAGGHARASNWVYSQRLRWARLRHAIDEADLSGAFLFKRFMDWYVPYFNAYSFPLARANEYEADAASARLTSPAVAAEALTGVTLLGRHVEERYWPALHRRVETEPEPVATAYSGLTVQLDDGTARDWLAHALGVPTDTTDTHPALRDRLAALGQQAVLRPPSPGEGAEKLLGALLPDLVAQLDREWQEGVRDGWRAQHEHAQGSRVRLAELQGRAASGEELPVGDALALAFLTETPGNDRAGALAQLHRLRDHRPDDAEVALALGSMLLEQDDPAGLAHAEAALRGEPQQVLGACEVLHNHHVRMGRHDEARQWRRRANTQVETLQQIDREARRVRTTDYFMEHGLPADALAAVRATLAGMPEVREAYLVRKRIEGHAEHNVYVLGVRVTGTLQLHSSKRADAAVQRLAETLLLPGNLTVLSVDADNAAFRKRFRQIAGAQLQ